MKSGKPIIGILGGVGSGKSTVAAEFARLGCAVIDADKIAHELLDEPEVREQVVALLGEEVLKQDSANGTGGATKRGRTIDRAKVAAIVFKDPEKLEKLTKILHPLVLERTEELIEQYNCDNRIKAIVLDMPLLVEVGWAPRCEKLIFVDCKEEIRQKRAENKGFEKNHIKIRENFQISLDKKKSIADNTVDNNSDFSALVRQIAEIFSYIMDGN